MRSIISIRKKPLILLLFFCVCVQSCRQSGNVLAVKIGNKNFYLEKAITQEQHQRGLMYRNSLGQDCGMVFIFPDDQVRSFWMKNTYIPLSIAYVKNDGTILDIKNMQPHNESSVISSGPVRYAIELNQGAFTRAGAGPGTKILLPRELIQGNYSR